MYIFVYASTRHPLYQTILKFQATVSLSVQCQLNQHMAYYQS